MTDVLLEKEPEKETEVEVEEKPAEKIEVSSKEDKEDKDYKIMYENLRTGIRDERKEKTVMRQELEQMQIKMSELDRMKKEVDDYRKGKKEEAALKEYQENPAAFLLRQQQELGSKIEGLTEEKRQQQESYQQRALFENTVRSYADRFAKEHNDYPDALEYVRNKRMKEYEIMGIDPGTYENMFEQESVSLAVQALRGDKNPAEVVYQMAQAWGYAPNKKGSSEDKVSKLEKGLKAAQTLSKGTSSEDDSTFLKSIESMDDKEFDKWWDSNIKNVKSKY